MTRYTVAFVLVPLAACAGERGNADEVATLVDEVGDGDGDGNDSAGSTGPLLDQSSAEGMMEAGDDEGTGEGTACEQAAAQESNQGCEFWAVDLPNAWQIGLQAGAEDQAFGIVVTNTAADAASVAVYAGSQGTPLEADTIAPGALRVFTFDNALGITPEGNTKGLAYRIESDRPVTAYQYNPLDNATPVYSNDASLLFPTHVLDLDYTAITGDALWLTTANGGAFVTAVASEDDTLVTFYPPVDVTMYPGNYVAVLNRGETYTMMSNEVSAPWMNEAGLGNLSGLRVASDKPVAVFSGNVCSWEPTPMEACCCDHMEHQMLPLTAWGQGYLVSTAAPASASEDDDVRVRIVGSFDGTALSYSPSAPPGAPTTIDAYQTVVFTTTSSFAVSGDKPFAVAEFLMSNEAVTIDPTPSDPDDNFFSGDPAMILIPPTAQFQSEYVFQVPAEYESNWVTVLRPTGGQVSLDGADKTNDPGWLNIGMLDGTTWQRGHFPISFGPHRVESGAPEGIGILVVGYDTAVSFGFAGGSGVEFQDEAPLPPPIP
ncbi:IgGFc-binding protein [Nannocystaceae bacterium ST9]